MNVKRSVMRSHGATCAAQLGVLAAFFRGMLKTPIPCGFSLISKMHDRTNDGADFSARGASDAA
jgi:hypothetical protein